MGNQHSSHHVDLIDVAASGDVAALTAQLKSCDINTQDEDGWSALHAAAFKGRTEAIDFLLSARANVDILDKEGRTPLHLAALAGEAVAAQRLCTGGANVRATDLEGMTALHKAAAQGHLLVTGKLLQCGADFSQLTQGGATAAHLAACKGRTDVLACLLKQGVHPNAATFDGSSLLHEAAAAGHADAVRLLLQKGASPVALNQQRKTARQVAQANGHREVVGVLPRDPRSAEQAGSPTARSRPHKRSLSQMSDSPARASSWTPVPASAPPQALQHLSHMRAFPPAAKQPHLNHRHTPHVTAAQCSKQARTPVNVHASARQREGSPGIFGDWGQASGSEAKHRPQDLTDTGTSQPSTPQLESSKQTPAAKSKDAAVSQRPASSPAKLLGWLQDMAGQSLSAFGLSPPKEAEQPMEQQPASNGSPEAGEVPSAPPAAAAAPALPRCPLISDAALSRAAARWTEERQLGASSSGRSFLGDLDGPVVIKRLHGNSLVAGKQFESGAATLSSLDHPHIARLLSYGYCGEHGCLVYPHYQLGSLDDSLRFQRPLRLDGTRGRSAQLDWRDRISACAHVAEALRFLHSRPEPLAHGTLRPSNVVIGEQDGAKSFLLADGGLSAVLEPGQKTAKDAYTDPDRQGEQSESAASDLYALGTVMLQLLTGQEAAGLRAYAASKLKADCSNVGNIVDPCSGDWPAQSSVPFAQLAMRCTAENSLNRPELPEVLKQLQTLAQGTAEHLAAPARTSQHKAEAQPLAPSASPGAEQPAAVQQESQSAYACAIPASQAPRQAGRQREEPLPA